MNNIDKYTNKSLNVFLVLLLMLSASGLHAYGLDLPKQDFPLSCTNFAASFDDKVLFGNSEDGGIGHPLFQDTFTSQMFYFPATGDEYGCATVGWYWQGGVSVQGGMNDQGLCYDQTGIRDTPVNTPRNPNYTVAGNYVMLDVLRQNANVEEVIDFFKSADWSGHWWYQWFFADASGDMVIISPGTDGELVFTRKIAGEDGFLTQTNFNRANNKSGTYPCWRYETSYELLSEIDNQDDLSISKFTDVLDAVHFRKLSSASITHYSNIFDPKNRMLYLAFLGQFDEIVSLNITEELADTRITAILPFGSYRAAAMSDYFSEETMEEGLSYYKKSKNMTIFLYQVLPFTGVAVVLIGIIIGIYFLVRKLRKRKQSKK